jgi:hypothetical protein
MDEFHGNRLGYNYGRHPITRGGDGAKNGIKGKLPFQAAAIHLRFDVFLIHLTCLERR